MADQDFDILSQFTIPPEDTTPVKQTRTNLGVVRNPLLLTYTPPPAPKTQPAPVVQPQAAPQLNLPRKILKYQYRQEQQRQPQDPVSQIRRFTRSGPQPTQPIIMPPTFERPFPETPLLNYDVPPNTGLNLDMLPVFPDPTPIVPNQGTVVNSQMFNIGNLLFKIPKITSTLSSPKTLELLIKFKTQLRSQERPPDISFTTSINILDREINNSSRTVESMKTAYNEAYAEYERAHDTLKQNDIITDDPSKLKTFTNTSDLSTQVKEYNAFILYLTSQKVKIPLNEIPKNIIDILPETVKASIESYNLYIEIPSALRTFDYDVKTLLLSNVPKSKPLTTIKPPAGYSTVGGTSFFKKIPSKIKSRNDNILGDYKITGSSSTINISNNDNQQFVVTQNNNKKVFNDPNEAQRFALMGAFDGDKVNKYRSTLTYESKLKPAFRVIPKAIF